MAYRRNYRRKKPVNRVKVYGRAGKQLYKDVMYVKSLINSELHYHITTQSVNFDSTGIVIPMSVIPVGDSNVNRTGNSILPRYLNIYASVQKGLAGPDHETFRLILFRYWGEATNIAPVTSVNEILSSGNTYSFLNEDNTGSRGDRERRIEIHKNKYFTLDNVASTSRSIKWSVQVNGVGKQVKEHMKYRTTATEQAISGGFHLLLLSSNTTAANYSDIIFNAKLSFYDN